VDNAKYFDNAMLKDFCHQVGMKVAFISVYHHQSNGAVERANALIFDSLQGNKLHTILIVVQSRSSIAGRDQALKPVNRHGGPSLPYGN
jgi:hypothetical protein